MNRQKFTLLILAFLFLGIYFWLATPLSNVDGISPRFDWPDEVSNYFWSTQYADTGQLVLEEPLNIVAKNQIHPRSFNVRTDGSIVPGSFLGLILFYGALAKLFGTGTLIYFTPIFAILGVLAFYGIIRRIFNDQIGFISAVLLLFHPAWWYYSVTTMLPNVTFASLFLISLYFLLKTNTNNPIQTSYVKQIREIIKLRYLFLSAITFGLAIAIRPSEVVWVAFVITVALFYIRRKINLVSLVVFFALTALMILPSLYHQQIVYGDMFITGYNQLQPVIESNSASCQSCDITNQFIAPFGFHPYVMALNVWHHLLSSFWLWSLLAILGFIALSYSRSLRRAETFAYIIVGGLASLFLVNYYGSWQFTDLMTLNLNTLGVSYIRYWIPIFLFMLPFVALGVMWLMQFFSRYLSRVILFLLIIFIGYQSAGLVLYEKSDSILHVRERIQEYKQVASEVVNNTPDDAIVVTVRKDKVFFPERKVIHTFDALSKSQDLVEIISELIKTVPVYYYALGPEPTEEIGLDLRLEQISTMGAEILYKVVEHEK